MGLLYKSLLAKVAKKGKQAENELRKLHKYLVYNIVKDML